MKQKQNFATSTSITSTYAGEFAGKYIAAALLSGKTLAGISSGFSTSGLAFSVVYKFSTETTKKEETK